MARSEHPWIARSDPFGKSPRLRARLAADPRFNWLDSIETKKIAKTNLASGATTLYTAPTKKRAMVPGGWLVVHNPTAGSITADFHHVPSGGSAGSTNKLVPTKTYAVDQTATLFSVDLWHVLMAGDALVINPGSAGLNVWFYVIEERAGICAFIGGFAGNLGTGDADLITVPAVRSLAFKAVYAFNPSGGAITLSVNVRESGVAVADSNELAAQSVGAGAEFQLDAALLPTLAEGGKVSARGSVAGLNVWSDAALF